MAVFVTNPIFDLDEKPIFDTSVASRTEQFIREAGNTVDFSQDPLRNEFIFRLPDPNAWYFLPDGYFICRFQVVKKADGTLLGPKAG